MNRFQSPEIGLHSAKQISSPVQRRTAQARVHKVRICHDNRPYVVVPWTITGTVQALSYGPMWPARRDYWIARISAEAGRHDSGTHPNDGTPGGQSIKMNLRRINMFETVDDPILANDARLNIPANHHRDAVNDSEDGGYEQNDFAITFLEQGDKVYPRFSQVGTTRPGTLVVISMVLVPIP